MSLFQLAAGLSLSDIVGGAKDVFEHIVNEAQNGLESLQEQSESSLNQIVQEANSQLDEILPELEDELTAEFSDVSEAASKIRECLEAQKENIEAIVESASKYANTTQCKPID
jgi:F0F1-type ATP synthase membrane subunit b/b'